MPYRETWAAYAYNPLPEQQFTRGTCEGLRHRGQARPAAAHYLELIYEQDQETLVVRQAWRTCDACHDEVERHRARLEGRGAPERPPSSGEPYSAGPRRHAAPDHRRDRL
jgi:hypothetical protein